MFDDLLTFKTLHECSAESYGFAKVKLLRDFGPYKKDDKVESLWFDLETGEVTEFDRSGVNPVKKFKFTLEARAP